jgi:hypothetical protein
VLGHGLSPLLILTCPYIVSLVHFFWIVTFFSRLFLCMTQAMTQMTQDDATQNGLRHAENPINYSVFRASMTQ